MVRIFPLLAALAVSGCAARWAPSESPTLHFHASYWTLWSAPSLQTRRPPPARLRARLAVEPLAAYYPRVVGIAFDGAGTTRMIKGSYELEADGAFAPEKSLTAALFDVLQAGDGDAVRLKGALTDFEVYRFGDRFRSRAVVELRAIRAGKETYAARYTSMHRYERAGASLARASTSDPPTFWRILEADLLAQIAGDAALLAALGGRAP